MVQAGAGVGAWVFVAVLIVASPVGAQGGLVDQRAEAKVTVEPAGENFTFSKNVSSDPDGVGDLECRGGEFTPLSQGFLFQSEEGRAACGEAIWSLDVPLNALLLRLSFGADRRISSSAELEEVEVVQEFTVFDQAGRVLSHQELFPPHNGSAPNKSFEVHVALTSSIREVHLLWHLEDKESQVPDTAVALPVGARFDAEVTQVRAGFEGVPVPGVQVEDHEDARQGDQIVRERDVSFQVPVAWWSQNARQVEVEVRLEVRTGYEPQLLVLPGGRTVSVDGLLIGSEEDQGEDSMVMVVPPSLLDAGGTGTYTMRLADRDAAAVFLPGGDMAGLLFLFLPAVSLVLAGRALSTHRPEGGAAYRVLRYGVPGLAVVLVAVGLVWIQGQGGVGLLTTRVMMAEAWWLFLALGLVFAGSIAVLMVEQKYNHRLRARDWLRTHQELAHERQSREQSEVALYAVAHDMKSPLLVLDHLVEDAASGTTGAQERREALDRSRSVITQMHNMVQDVLDYAVHTGEATRLGKTWIRPMVDQVVQTLRQSADRGNVRFVVEGRADACLLSPSEALHSVLTNLVCNAVKYSSHEDAFVRVSIRAEGAPKKRELVLEVADNGPGVPQADRERVFGFLTRLPDRKGRNVPGSGVGLAIVKRVVEEQGGKVEVDDAPEGGALFRVVWPAQMVAKWRTVKEPLEKEQARIHQSGASAEEVHGLSKWVEGMQSDPGVPGTG